MHCFKPNDGTIVAAHSNQYIDGKGKGLKAHDFRIAYLCYTCHSMIDQGSLDRANSKAIWDAAHRETIGWLFLTGKLQVV